MSIKIVEDRLILSTMEDTLKKGNSMDGKIASFDLSAPFWGIAVITNTDMIRPKTTITFPKMCKYGVIYKNVSIVRIGKKFFLFK